MPAEKITHGSITAMIKPSISATPNVIGTLITRPAKTEPNEKIIHGKKKPSNNISKPIIIDLPKTQGFNITTINE